MKNRYLVIIIIILSIIVYRSSKKTTSFLSEEENICYITLGGTDEKIDLEDYVIGVVSAEMPASFDEEALKAQAVASRTYALYKTDNCSNNITTDVSSQVYISISDMEDKWGSDFDKYYEKVKSAVRNTQGEVMTYNGEVISSYYFAIGNGYTEDSEMVFKESKDYLKSVYSKDEDVKNFLVTKEYSKEEFCNSLNIDCSNITISNIVRSDTNRVNSITINDKVFTGSEVRSLLNLRSTDFEIEVGEVISITTKGYGHGVGMSQYGANNLAKEGYTYQEILKYYYQNIDISSV